MRRRPGLWLTLGALAVGVVLLGAAGCGSSNNNGGNAGSGGNTSAIPPHQNGGTMKIALSGNIDYLDPALAYYQSTWQIEYSTCLKLTNYPDLAGDAGRVIKPEAASALPTISPDGLTYTYTVPAGKFKFNTGEPVTAATFQHALERDLNPKQASYFGAVFLAPFIKGAADFGAGKAKTISGMVASGNTLTITLVKPAADFLSILAMPFFSPRPKEAEKYKPGADYSKHVIGSGPYTLKSYVPTKSMEFVRNTNWDPATDPLRKAWVDGMTMRIGLEPDAIQQTIERGDADMSLDTSPPNASLQRLSTDPKLKQQFAVETTGCSRYFTLETNPKADTPQAKISDVKVRQAINYALDKVALQRARGGPLAGDPASTILTPTLIGFSQFNLYPSPDNKGDIAKAKQLLSEAGFPNGITLNYVGQNAGKSAAVNTAAQSGLARANIKLNIKTFSGFSIYTDSLGLPAKRTQHQMGNAGWCPDYPGDGTRSFMVPLLDGRSIQPAGNNNYGEYNNPAVNANIDRALAEPDKTKRGQLWNQIDKQIMQDAAWAPYLYDKTQYFWSPRTKNWVWTAWSTEPDLTALWLNPNTP